MNSNSNNLSITEQEMYDNSNKFFTWVQSFSKIIVTITFFIFVAINIFILIFVIAAFLTTGSIVSIDTLIAETHQTFRDVIGGYIIKAAAENVFRIAGSTIERYLVMKSSLANANSNSEYIPDEELPVEG